MSSYLSDRKFSISFLIIMLLFWLLASMVMAAGLPNNPILYRETGGSRAYLHELEFPVGSTTKTTTGTGRNYWNKITLDFDNAGGWTYSSSSTLIYADQNGYRLGASDNLGISINTDGDVTFDASGADIHFGADDDICKLAIHDAGYLTIYDDSDDTSVVIGPVTNGSTTLGITGSLDCSGQVDAGTLTINSGSITDSSGAISFGNENLTTSGTLLPGDIRTIKVSISDGNGGLYIYRIEAAANITASASVTIQVNIPSGAKIMGCQLRVDTALTGGELWDAAYETGSTQAIASAQAVAKNTKVNKFFNENAATAITTAETDIAVTKNGGGSFTAAGNIRAIVYYQMFTTMGDAS